MPIHFEEALVTISGRIGAEECQDLQNWLLNHPRAAIDLSGCEHLHAAGLQCLLALQPAITEVSADPWLNAALGALQQSSPISSQPSSVQESTP
jgi:anti-anti-sigma regulatory factor